MKAFHNACSYKDDGEDVKLGSDGKAYIDSCTAALHLASGEEEGEEKEKDK